MCSPCITCAVLVLPSLRPPLRSPSICSRAAHRTNLCAARPRAPSSGAGRGVAAAARAGASDISGDGSGGSGGACGGGGGGGSSGAGGGGGGGGNGASQRKRPHSSGSDANGSDGETTKKAARQRLEEERAQRELSDASDGADPSKIVALAEGVVVRGRLGQHLKKHQVRAWSMKFVIVEVVVAVATEAISLLWRQQDLTLTACVCARGSSCDAY
jgi:hypothetical protein